MPNTYQIASMEKLLDWLKTCPNETYISSLQGNQLHVKFYVPMCKNDEKKPWFKSHTVGLTIDSGMIVPPKMEKIMKNIFYVYHHDIDKITKFETKEQFVNHLNHSADWTCQTYATSIESLRELVFDTYGVKI